MKIINPSFTIEERDEQRGGLDIIVKAGRVCYKTEDTATSAPETFVRNLILHGHNSVLEHGDMIFEIADRHIYENVAEALQIIRDSGEQPPMLEMTRIGGRCIISGNIRAWRELFAIGSLAGAYFIGHFDPVYVQGFGFIDECAEPDPRIRQIHYADLHEYGEKRAHLRQSVRFIIDRGVSHEFVRHRTMSFSQESTRFCNYNQDRFGNEISVIAPPFVTIREGEVLNYWWDDKGIWWRAAMNAEVSYSAMIKSGRSPQEARSVLNNSTKTELMMTGNLRAWDFFFDLRARQIAGKAHPQAVEVAAPVYEYFKALYPDIFD